MMDVGIINSLKQNYLNLNNNAFVYSLITINFLMFFALFKMCAYYFKTHDLFSSIKGFDNKINFVVRMVSSIHAVLSTGAALLVLYFDKDIYLNELLFKSYGITLTLTLSIGYMAYDICIMSLYRQTGDAASFLHHFVSIVAFHACSTRGVFPLIAIVRLTSEFSTPFINNRWFMVTLNKKDSKYFKYNAYIMVITFCLCRIFPIVPIWLQFYSLINTPTWNQISLFDKFLCVGSSMPLDILNVWWFSKIVKGALKYRSETAKKEN